MKKQMRMGMIAVGCLLASNISFAESKLAGSIGADIWDGRTKVEKKRQDTELAYSVYGRFESDIAYLPNFKLRYTNTNADAVSFDKVDYTAYYRVLNKDVIRFNVGLSASQIINGQYLDPVAGEREFDLVMMTYYADAALLIPNTNFSIIGEMEFGNSGDTSLADVTAGIQYDLALDNSTINFRAGYRVIDLAVGEFDTANPPLLYVDGFFAGVQASF